jgi:hypothetical protein
MRLGWLVVALLVAPLVANAAVITQYGSRADWIAAVGTSTVIDFEGLAQPGNGFGIPVPPGLTLSGVNFSTATPTSGIDFILAGPLSYGPSSVLALYDDSVPRTLNLVFPNGGSTGIAFDLGKTVISEDVTVMLSTGDSFVVVVPVAPFPGYGFVGFTSSVPVIEVSIIESRGGTNVLLLDNVSFGAALPPPPTVTVSNGSGQSTRVGTGFAQPLVALVKDSSNNPVANATVTWTVPVQAASATFMAPPSTVTNAAGLATITATANAISGAYVATASVGASSTSFNLTNTITIAAGNTCAGDALTNADLVEQYYAAILRRPSDSGGKTFWSGEADRLCALGADPKEAFFLMANTFFNSPEYLAFNRDDTGFVTDNYITFFGRLPDANGQTYWLGQLAAGNPRNNVMSSFLFSPEFTATMNGVFPGRTARAETYLVLNLYGGFFRRLADSGGYTYWDGQFRAAQCMWRPATAVQGMIDTVSALFVGSAEYVGRATTNSQYVQDLYYAMLQRGGDLTGVNYWVGQLNSGTQTRGQVRQQFLGSPEMAAQSAAIAAQGCLP